MLTRREWIETTTAFSAWPVLRPSAQDAARSSVTAGAPDDEAFWGDVRAQFELIQGPVNLVTVVRG